MKNRDLALLTDFYQLTMSNGYLKSGKAQNIAVFDLFFRSCDQIQYAVACGLDQAIEFITSLKYTEDDLSYLKKFGNFDDVFIDYLRNFKFTGDMYAVPEGTIIYPNEPILTIKAPLIEAQLLETPLLTIINHQTLIATKASKMVSCTEGGILEFGLRRAQGPDAGIYGTRASIIGGCVATSNVLAGKMFDIPVSGTHSHSWVMAYDDEITAFREYAKLYPQKCLLLVDTYDTLGTGVPNAIKVFDELKETGNIPLGIRLDSGDLSYLSIAARKMLDDAGHTEARIYASCDIDEELLLSLKAQGSKIDVWGIGTRLITSYDNPSLGGVYKLVAIEKNGEIIPRIKISDNSAKTTIPCLKKIIRFFNNNSHKAIADLLMLKNEDVPSGEDYTIFDSENPWKQITLKDYYTKDIMQTIFSNGELLYTSPTIKKIAEYAKESKGRFWDQYLRIHNPAIYKVDLSSKLYDIRKELLHIKYK